MNRFIRIRISKTMATIDDIVERARQYQISSECDWGFEVNTFTRSKVQLTWSEKTTIVRRFESGAFGEQSFEEVKIVSFGILFNKKDKTVILVNPPVGKHKVHKVLRMLFESSGFVFDKIDLKTSIETVGMEHHWKVVAIQTELECVSADIFMSLSLMGGGNLKQYLDLASPGSNFPIKSLCFLANLGSGGVKVVLSSSGLVRFSREVTIDDVEFVAGLLAFE